MDALSTLEIIDTLAQGVHPLTGEVLPDDSPYNAPAVIRALFTVSRVLSEQAGTRRRRHKILPANAGQPWSDAEDRLLGERVAAGDDLKALAQQLGRTRWALESRLLKLGHGLPAG